MFINPISHIRATFFIKLLIVFSSCAIVALLILPASTYAVSISIVVHATLAVAMFWFMVKVVWPVRASLDELVLAVEKHQPEAESEIRPQTEFSMGSYEGLIRRTTVLLESQYEELTSHSQQLENFSQVLEKQNSKISGSRQRYRKTLDVLENGLYSVDDSFIIQSVNRAEAEFLGTTPKDIVGKHCYQVFRQRQKPCSDCMPRECMADGEKRTRLRVENCCVGREFVNVFCYPVFPDGESQSREVVVYIQDVSQLALMEEQVVRSERMASVGQMAAGIAHDLNNYLAGIFGIVDMLRMHFKTNPAERAKDLRLLGRLTDQVEALNRMAGNLMIFSYPERKEMFPLSLNQMIDDALSFSRYELEREQVALKCDFTEDLPPVWMEKGQIQQVILNLMLNGAQAIREQKAAAEEIFAGLIVVSTGIESAGSIYFSITDNGIGITSESAKHLFDPFFSTKEVKVERGATGLGLFTARTIVEQHQGTISFSSKPGQGSCFKVVLPLEQGA